jgi:hypothetical protein
MQLNALKLSLIVVWQELPAGRLVCIPGEMSYESTGSPVFRIGVCIAAVMAR